MKLMTIISALALTVALNANAQAPAAGTTEQAPAQTAEVKKDDKAMAKKGKKKAKKAKKEKAAAETAAPATTTK